MQLTASAVRSRPENHKLSADAPSTAARAPKVPQGVCGASSRFTRRTAGAKGSSHQNRVLWCTWRSPRRAWRKPRAPTRAPIVRARQLASETPQDKLSTDMEEAGRTGVDHMMEAVAASQTQHHRCPCARRSKSEQGAQPPKPKENTRHAVHIAEV